MKTATIEILREDETILGSTPIGQYFVREYDENREELGGQCFKYLHDAVSHVKKYQDMKEE